MTLVNDTDCRCFTRLGKKVKFTLSRILNCKHLWLAVEIRTVNNQWRLLGIRRACRLCIESDSDTDQKEETKSMGIKFPERKTTET
jgi:hypothetical protein